MIEFGANTLSLVVCEGLALLAMAIAAILGTRARLKYAKQIRENQERGLYSDPRFLKRIRTMLFIEVFILIGIPLSALLAIVQRSFAGIIVMGLLLLAGVIIGLMLHRAMAKGMN